MLKRLGKGAEILYGQLSVSITDHDIDDVKIRLSPGAALTATVHMAEDDAALPADFDLALFDADGERFAEPAHLKDGRFHIEGIPPGKYWPEFVHLPPGYAEIRGDGEPVSQYGPAELALVLTSKPGIIVGTVRDENGGPVKAATVVLVPDLAELSRVPAMGKRVASGAAGEFRFGDLAPGKYRVNGLPVEVGLGQTVVVTVTRENP